MIKKHNLIIYAYVQMCASIIFFAASVFFFFFILIKFGFSEIPILNKNNGSTFMMNSVLFASVFLVIGTLTSSFCFYMAFRAKNILKKAAKPLSTAKRQNS